MIDDPRYFVITRTPFVSLSSFLTSITAAQLIASAVLGRSCVWRLELVEAPLQHEGPPPDHPRLTNIAHNLHIITFIPRIPQLLYIVTANHRN